MRCIGPPFGPPAYRGHGFAPSPALHRGRFPCDLTCADSRPWMVLLATNLGAAGATFLPSVSPECPHARMRTSTYQECMSIDRVAMLFVSSRSARSGQGAGASAAASTSLPRAHHTHSGIDRTACMMRPDMGAEHFQDLVWNYH